MVIPNISYHLKSSLRRTPLKIAKTKNLPFGKLRSAHMFLMDYVGDWEGSREGEWVNPRVVQYRSGLSNLHKNGMQVGSKVFHYGYGVFEGAKAFQHQDGELYTCRLNRNAARLNRSARMLEMPIIPEDYFLTGVNNLLDIDRLYYPQGVEGASLYIRPFMMATQDQLGVGPGNSHTFAVFLSPSGPYYECGFDPISLLVQNIFHRATPGGVGGAKAAGNYAGAARAARLGKLLGAKQVLFLDAIQKMFAEEVGTSALGIVKGSDFCMPTANDTILNSTSANNAGDIVEAYDFSDVGVERALRCVISKQEMISGLQDGSISEITGLGTAAVVGPVKSLRELRQELLSSDVLKRVISGDSYVDKLVDEFLARNSSHQVSDLYNEVMVGDGKTGQFTRKLFDTVTGIQYGTLEDKLGMMTIVNRAA